MESPGSDPLAPKSVFGSSFIKKKSRYDEEDIVFSPPDDSSFFSLRFGPHRNRPNESMYDRINKELGLSLESSKGNVTPELNVAPAVTISNGTQAQLLLGPSGIILANPTSRHSQQPEFKVITNPNASTTPTLIFPESISENKEERDYTTAFGSFRCQSEATSPASQEVENLVRKARGGRPSRKISANLIETLDRNSLLECLDEHKAESETAKPYAPPLCAFGPPPPTPSESLIKSIPRINERQRKTSAPPSLNPMLMETQKASNYFFTGSVFSTSSTTDIPSSVSPDAELITKRPQPLSEPSSPERQVKADDASIGANLTLEQTTILMEQRASEAAALYPKQKMGKRRPKASALREMNFWAPQSM